MLKANRLTLLMAGLCLLASPLAFAQCDMHAAIDDSPDPAETGQDVTFTTDFGNNGPGTPVSPFLNVEMPPGVPATIAELTDDQANALEASASSTLGEPSLYLASTCENLLWQIDLATIGTNGSGTFVYTTPMPAAVPLSPTLTVNSPASVAGDYPFGRGTCSDCDTMACFGPRVSEFAQVTADLVMVDDGSGAGNEGCNPSPANAYDGMIAVVYRGTCEFGYKALYAEQSGAIATIIGDNNDGRVAPTDFINPGGGVVGELVTIPVAYISFNDIEALAAVMATETVNATLGSAATGIVRTRSDIWENTATTTDTDLTNDTEVESTTIGSIPHYPPVASFTFAPTNPDAGVDVTFTDTTTNTPTSWAWDFGDGGTSTDQNPTHAYAADGVYTVSLTATNADGSDTATASITVGGIPPQELYFVAAAAFGAGAAGSNYVTDLDINNAGTTDMTYTFWWLPRDENNSTPTESAEFTLAAGASVRYANVLDAVFSAPDGSYGALAIAASSPDALIMSRTFNSSATGTFGQAIPGIYADDLIPSGTTVRIIFMTQNTAYRSNVGFINGNASAITVTVTLYGADGAVLDTRTVDLPPYGNTQLNRVFSNFEPVDTGYVDVSATGAFYCYGSVLDNATNDPTTVLPQ